MSVVAIVVLDVEHLPPELRDVLIEWIQHQTRLVVYGQSVYNVNFWQAVRWLFS